MKRWDFILTDPWLYQVLLPPRPAAIYANLLKVEAHILAKDGPEYARDIQHIRHLKEAMIKKCQQLALDQLHSLSDTTPSHHPSVVEAPEDFKLKRLEQWWAGMEDRTKAHPDSLRQRGMR